MANEEEELMRQILDEKTMDVDLPAELLGEPSETESNKKKSRKSTPKKSNPNPK